MAGHWPAGALLPNHFQVELERLAVGRQSSIFAVGYDAPFWFKYPSAFDWLGG